jgi:hypothetical protein
MTADETARRLSLTLGSDAGGAVALCLEDCRRLGDTTAARYWTDVAARLPAEVGSRSASPDGAACAPKELTPDGRSWVLMQRIERYRHRAMQIERQMAGSDTHQADMLDIALQWLELARQSELLTRDVDELLVAPPPRRAQAIGRR